jgi:membrane-associated phospholipid phosphatase
MFQTEPILFLQGISSDLLLQVMLLVNTLGRPVTGILLAVILLHVDLKRGFVLLHMLVVTAIITEFLKDYMALPRPIFVDASIQFLDQQKVNTTPLIGMGAESFLAALPQPAIDFCRANFAGRWGLPSGHVSATVALWITLAMLYRKSWLWFTAGLLIPGVALARMYFGKHFLADVLAGILVGIVVTLVAYIVVLRPSRFSRFLATGRRRAGALGHELLYYAYLIVLPVGLLSASFGESIGVACLLGGNIGFIVLRAYGQDVAVQGFRQHLARGIAGILVLGVLYLAAIAPGWLSARIGTAGELMLLAVLCFALIVSAALVDKLFNRSSIGA